MLLARGLATTLPTPIRFCSQIEPTSKRCWYFRRRGEDLFDCFLVPIDACYELTGRVRRTGKVSMEAKRRGARSNVFSQTCARKCREPHEGNAVVSELAFEIVRRAARAIRRRADADIRAEYRGDHRHRHPQYRAAMPDSHRA